MLVSKIIQIGFADSRVHGEDAFVDIRKAAEAASLNLFSRYDVRLQEPRLIDNGKIVIEVKIPEEIAETFSIGNHLRGISSYLLKNCNGRYDQYIVGKRLLTYYEIPNPEIKEDEFSLIDRMEAISDFARLLERSDDEAMDYIRRILNVLKEVKTI